MGPRSNPRSKYEASNALKTMKQDNQSRDGARVPHYLRQTKNAVKIQKENKEAKSADQEPRAKKKVHKELSQLSRLELERVVHMKGGLTRHRDSEPARKQSNPGGQDSEAGRAAGDQGQEDPVDQSQVAPNGWTIVNYYTGEKPNLKEFQFPTVRELSKMSSTL